MASAELLLPLIGVLIGGGLTIGGQLFIEWRKTTAERRALAHAVAAEIESHLDLMERRRNLEYAHTILEMNRAGNFTLPKKLLTDFEKANDPLPVIRTALPKIGLLGDLCADVAAFYTTVAGVRITIIGIDEGKYDHLSPSQAASLLEGEIELWKEAVVVGRRTIEALRAT